MNCSRRRFKSRNPEGFRSDSIPGLEHPPETIWYLKCTNRLRGWFESSYWEHRIFSHMRSCQCKNYIFWTTGTQVMIFYLEFIEDSRWEISHLSNYTSLGIKIFHIWKRHKRNIFHQKIGLLEHLEQYQKFCSPKKKFVAGSIPVMRKNASFFAPQGTNLNFRKNCILSACNPFNDDPVQKTIKLSRTKDTKKRRNVFFFFFLISFFVFFLFNVIYLTFFFSSNAQRFPQVFLHFSVFQVFPAFKSVFNSSGQKYWIQHHTVPGWSPTPVLSGLKPR